MTDPILRWHEIIKAIDPVIDVEHIPCDECGGERYCEYGRGEDVRTEPCEKCNLGGDEPDGDEEYERQRDAEAEAHFEKKGDRD